MSHTVLVVDDDATIRKTLAMLIVRKMEFRVAEAENGKEGLSILEADREGKISLAILDLNMPGIGGLEALKIIRERHPHIPVLVLTASREEQDAAQAVRLGAADFMTKPVQPERLIVSVQNAIRMYTLSSEVARLKKEASGALTFADLIGYDGGLKAVVASGRKAAGSNIPVLIGGETGTGKEVFARALHGESIRAGAPFVAVNCGAIPEKLVESTLFGHEKGAFTGAVAKAAGKFREAQGGTIFLDEVGDLPLEAQVKLLRVLQQKEVEPVGAGLSVPVDVRILSATNKNLEQEVCAGRFREDLFFRLNVLPLSLPPLRDRRGDIPALTRGFIARFAAGEGREVKPLSPEAERMLAAHDWPGNVRELENAVHRAMVLGDHPALRPEDFTLNARGQQGGAGDSATAFQQDATTISILTPGGMVKPMAEIEEEVISTALSHHRNNVTRAAAELGVAKSTLYRKMGKKVE